jgi:ribose transport system ATP-binding protein
MTTPSAVVEKSTANAAPGAGHAAELLRLNGLTKRFPGVDALVDVDFDLKAGEVHVLFGENGAGKSTLISIVAGVYRPTAGRVVLHGREIELGSVHEARQNGISAVFQEFSIVPQLTVEENIFLGAEVTSGPFLDKAELNRRAREILDRLGFPLNPTERVAYLSRAERQMVEIAKAFRSEPKILIFDEPTASLTERETGRLFALIEQAKRDGVGIIYITHRMGEIRRIGDRITVLRDGRKIATLDAKSARDERLIELMSGRVISEIFPVVSYRPGRQLLQVRNLTLAGGAVRDASIDVREGEIVGIAGLVGSGKSELGRACFGLERIASGRIVFDGVDVTGLTVRDILARGVFYVPSDRREEGLLMVRGARENMALASLDQPEFSGPLLLNRRAERERTRRIAERVDLRPRNLERDLEHFSGGNQQKVMIAKALSREVKLFIFDEPTVGVDVGTRVAIYGFIRELCEAGAGVLLISSDLPEILHLTNRAYVMYRGELRAELSGAEITQEKVLSHFFEKEAA